jgi:hypothetical protein
MRVHLGLLLLASLVGCRNQPLELGTQSCVTAGGSCASFPAGCPCGTWSEAAICSAPGTQCCVQASCSSDDLGPAACFPLGTACRVDSDCCSNVCPSSGDSVGVCAAPTIPSCGSVGGSCVQASKCETNAINTNYACTDDAVCCLPTTAQPTDGSTSVDGGTCVQAEVATEIAAFLQAHEGCTQDSDCVLICSFADTCLNNGINKNSEAAFLAMFSSCQLSQCNIGCLPVPTCNQGKCTN